MARSTSADAGTSLRGPCVFGPSATAPCRVLRHLPPGFSRDSGMVGGVRMALGRGPALFRLPPVLVRRTKHEGANRCQSHDSFWEALHGGDPGSPAERSGVTGGCDWSAWGEPTIRASGPPRPGRTSRSSPLAFRQHSRFRIVYFPRQRDILTLNVLMLDRPWIPEHLFPCRG